MSQVYCWIDENVQKQEGQALHDTLHSVLGNKNFENSSAQSSKY